jgi:hypothetical protein
VAADIAGAAGDQVTTFHAGSVIAAIDVPRL